jgi:hypothetical protein
MIFGPLSSPFASIPSRSMYQLSGLQAGLTNHGVTEISSSFLDKKRRANKSFYPEPTIFVSVHYRGYI